MAHSTDSPIRRPHTAALLAVLLLLAAAPAHAVDYCYLYQGQGHNDCHAPDVWPDLTVAGESYELRKGIYRANSLQVGGAQPGAVIQSGGLNTIRSGLLLGRDGGEVGSYNLLDGLLSSDTTVVGDLGSATMVQFAGTHLASTALDIGSSGRYALSGGLVQTRALHNAGVWVQTGGQLIVDVLMEFRHSEVWLQGGRMQLPANTQVGNYSRLQVDAGELVLAGPLLLASGNSAVAQPTALLDLNGGVVRGDIAASYGAYVVGGGGHLDGDLQLRGRAGFSTVAAMQTSLRSLDVGAVSLAQVAGGLVIEKTLTLQRDGTLSLQGSTLTVGLAILNNGNIEGSGRIQALSMQGSGNLTQSGGDLVLALPGGASLSGPITLEQGRRVTLEGGELTVGAFMAVQGATVDGTGTLRVPAGARLRGPGNIETRLAMDGTIEIPQGRLSITQAWGNDGLVVVDTAGELSGGQVDNHGTLVSLGRVTAPVRNRGQVQLSGGSFLQSLSTDAGGRLSVIAASNLMPVSLGRLVMAAGAAPVQLGAGAVLLMEGDADLAAGSSFLGTGRVSFGGGAEIAGTGIGRVHATTVLQLAAGARLTLDLAGTGAQQYDQMDSMSGMVFGGTLALRLSGGYLPAAGDSFALLGGVLSGQFAAIDTTLAPLAAGLVWDSTRLGSDGTLRVVAVPEPAPWALALAGGLGLLARRHRYRLGGFRSAAPGATRG